MTKGLALLVAIAGTLFGPVPVAHGACAKSSTGPSLDAQLRAHTARQGERHTPTSGPNTPSNTVTTTSLRVCNRRTGLTTVLGRGRLVVKERGRPLRTVYARGRRVATVSAGGRYVAWEEVSVGAAALDRATVVLRLAEFPSGRVVRVRVIRLHGTAVFWDRIPLVVNRWGDLVWAAFDTPAKGVWLWRIGRHPTRLAGDSVGHPRLFDDGRTLVLDYGGRILDLRPPRLRDGCPDREQFEAVLSTPKALITRARLRMGEDETAIVWRTCWRSAHRDAVAYHALDGHYLYPRVRVMGYAEPWLLLSTEILAKTDRSAGLRLVNVASAATTSFGEAGALGQPAWTSELDAVVLPDGSSAWVGKDPLSTRYAVELTRPDGSQTELDTASSGIPTASPLTALSGQGFTLTWLHDGQPRSYVVGGA
jgi:hypothetical protein